LELNDVRKAEIVPIAGTAEVGSVKLADYGPGHESWSTVAPRESERASGVVRAAGHATVPSTTLDACAAAAGVDRSAVAKIDVEGEALVVAGAERLLSRGATDVLLVGASDRTLEAAGTSVLGLREHSLEVLELHAGTISAVRIAGRVERVNAAS
jgi:FkbM family methyltransferase